MNGGSYSLASVSYKQTSFSTWQSGRTDNALTTGTDSTTNGGQGTSGGQATAALGNFSFSQTSSDSYTTTSSDTSTQSGMSGSTLSEFGRFANYSASFNSLVYRAGSSQSQTYAQQSTSTFTGSSHLGYSSSASANMPKPPPVRRKNSRRDGNTGDGEAWK